MDFKPFSILLPLVALLAFLALHQLLFPLPMAFSLTIATFNCRGFTKPSKQAEVLELAKSKHVDILLLQETYIHSAAQIRNFDSSFKTRSLWSFGRTGSCGVAIVLMPHFEGSVLRHSRDSEGRTLWIDLDCGIRVVNVYAPLRPRSNQAEFFHTLDDILLGPSRVVVAGDFNVVLNTTDRSSNRGKHVAKDYSGVKALRTLVDELELVDAWRALRPGQAGMTWTGRGSQSRLDRFYVSQSLAISMHSTWITGSVPRPRGLWAGAQLFQGKCGRISWRVVGSSEVARRHESGSPKLGSCGEIHCPVRIRRCRAPLHPLWLSWPLRGCMHDAQVSALRAVRPRTV